MATTAISENIDIGRILQRGFATIGRNALAFFGAAFVLVGLPSVAAYMFVLGRMDAVETNPLDSTYWTGQFLLILISFITGAILQAAIVRSSILDLGGRDPDMAGSFGTAVSMVFQLVGLAIVMSIGFALGLLLLIVPGVILYVMWLVAVPVMVEERRGIFGSLARSAELAKGSKWQIFGLVVIIFIVSFVISFVFGLFAPALMDNLMLMSVLSSLAAAVSAVVMAGILASLYVELRTVKEGADTNSLAAVFE